MIGGCSHGLCPWTHRHPGQALRHRVGAQLAGNFAQASRFTHLMGEFREFSPFVPSLARPVCPLSEHPHRPSFLVLSEVHGLISVLSFPDGQNPRDEDSPLS